MEWTLFGYNKIYNLLKTTAEQSIFSRRLCNLDENNLFFFSLFRTILFSISRFNIASRSIYVIISYNQDQREREKKERKIIDKKTNIYREKQSFTLCKQKAQSIIYRQTLMQRKKNSKIEYGSHFEYDLTSHLQNHSYLTQKINYPKGHYFKGFVWFSLLALK